MDELRVARLTEKTEHRFWGKYRAFVSDNADPEKRGRLRLQIPAVLGPSVVSGWALPCAPFGGVAGQGIFFVPEPGAGVWVEFEAGLLEYPVWVGTFWSKPGGTTEVPPPADQQSPPTSKLIRTSNHTIELADASGSEAIVVTDAANQNKVTLDASGIVVEDGNGNKITLDSAGITFEASQIKIGAGASAEKLVLGTTLVSVLQAFEAALLTHTHVGNLGAPTTPPTPPLVLQNWNSVLSQHHVVE